MIQSKKTAKPRQVKIYQTLFTKKSTKPHLAGNHETSGSLPTVSSSLSGLNPPQTSLSPPPNPSLAQAQLNSDIRAVKEYHTFL